MPTLQESIEALTKAVEGLIKSAKDKPASSPLGGGGSGRAAGSIDEWAARFNRKIGSQLKTYASKKVGQWGGGDLLDIAKASRSQPATFMGDAAATGRGAAGAGGAGGGAAAGAGRAAAAAGPAGIAVAVVLACVTALVQFREKLIESAKAQQAVNFHYAAMSASMANVAVRSEIATMKRERDIGDRTATTAAYLSAQNTKSDDQTAEFEVLWNNIKNGVLGVMMEGMTEALTPLADAVKVLNDTIAEFLPKADKGNDTAAWLEDTAKKGKADREAGAEWFNRRKFD